MNIIKGQHWTVIPSRANSRRFPRKAFAELENSFSLLENALWIAKQTTGLSEIIINTNDEEIIAQFPQFRIYRRPDVYAQADTRIDDTLINMVVNMEEVPEFLHLVQLTSPFIHYSHIEEGISLLQKHRKADSVQLVTPVSNICHAYSQRVIIRGFVDFRFPRERHVYYNSQSKSTHYVFCGYVGFRTESLLKYGNIWGKKSLPIIGGPECAIDIDTPEDLKFAECYLQMKREEAKYASNI